MERGQATSLQEATCVIIMRGGFCQGTFPAKGEDTAESAEATKPPANQDCRLGLLTHSPRCSWGTTL